MNFDILIKRGKILDGTGNPWFNANLGIKADKIAKISRMEKITGTKELDANGMIVCPGFVDPHGHSDFYIPFDPKLQSFTRQGITTHVVGMCGSSLAPINSEKIDEFRARIASWEPPGAKLDITWLSFAEYLTAMDQIGCASNVVPFVGFLAIRLAAGPGFENRPPTPEELVQMKALVAEAMEAGAFGFSTGLYYTPQTYARTEEILELTKVVAKYNGLYFTHLRSEGAHVVEAVKEAIMIVEQSGCAGGQIAHHKIASKPHWGLSKDTLQLIEDAYKRGVNITVDQYPYNRLQTSLATAVPPWVHEGGMDKLVERLKNPEIQEKVKAEINTKDVDWENLVAAAGWDGIYIAKTKSEETRVFEGKSLSEITRLKNNPDEYTTLFEVLIADGGLTSVTVNAMGAEDMKRIMTHHLMMVGTDGWGVAPTGLLGYGKPHPRLYGTYPRVLRKYVREEGVLTWEAAIRKMTSFPAQKLGLLDRGILREGMVADIVLFDPDNVQDIATFENPHQFATGIKYVIINGEIVVEDERQTARLPGKFLRRPS